MTMNAQNKTAPIQEDLFSEPINSESRQVQVSDIFPPENKRILDTVKTLGVLMAVGLAELDATSKHFPKYRYSVVYGERRVSSAIACGLETIPAIIVPNTERQQAALRIVENGDRSSNLVAEALAIGILALEPSVVKARYGMETETVKLRMRLLELGVPVLELVNENRVLSESVAMRMANLSKTFRDIAVAEVLALVVQHEAVPEGVSLKIHNEELRKQGLPGIPEKYTDKMLSRVTQTRNKASVQAFDSLAVNGPATASTGHVGAGQAEPAPALLQAELDEAKLAGLATQVMKLAEIRQVNLAVLIARLTLELNAGKPSVTAVSAVVVPVQLPVTAPIAAPAAPSLPIPPVNAPANVRAPVSGNRTSTASDEAGRSRGGHVNAVTRNGVNVRNS